MMAVFCILFSLVSHTRSGNSIDYNDIVLRDAVFMLRAIAMLLLLTWLLYLVTFRFLFSIILVWLHVLSTITITISIAVLLFKKIINHEAPVLQRLSETVVSAGNVWGLLPMLGVLIFFAQMIYIVNLMLGIIKRMN